MSIGVKTLDHVSLTVSDLERSLGFYRDLLGMEEVENHRLEGEGISAMAGKPGVVLEVVRLAWPQTTDILLDLQRYVAPPGGVSDAQLGDVGHSHICFGVDDILGACRELRANGVELVSDPVEFQLSSGVLRVVFLKDPDGNVLELVQYPEQG
jgi:catechol 2,3-dioxygenase-like lactoylglutathione lyase family enzyme